MVVLMAIGLQILWVLLVLLLVVRCVRDVLDQICRADCRRVDRCWFWWGWFCASIFK